jgi:hypothetical protein
MRLPVLLFVLLPFLSAGQEWKNFTDTAGMFSAKYPSAWVNKIKENNRVFFTSPRDNSDDLFLENINISVTPKEGYGEDVKMADVFTAVTDALKQNLIDFVEESRRNFKWNGADAAEIIYTGYSKSDESMKIRTIQWYCFHKSRLYIATFVSEAAKTTHTNTAKKILASILFK